MRIHIYHLTTIAIIILFAACCNESLFNQINKELSHTSERTISFTASMPGDPATRVALTQEEDLGMKLTWEEGDQIQLAFVQGGIKKKKTVTVNSITSDGKDAKFNIEIPAEINRKFDLYGVYGGGGLSEDNPTLAKLPMKSGDAGSLESVKERKDVMLYFVSKDMEIADSEASVIFKHLGSLFSITFNNISAANVDGLKEARLVGIGGDGKWAYNTGAGGNSYDLITGKFLNTETAGNFLTFNINNKILQSGKSITFWSWYPPLDIAWPELRLELRNARGEVVVTSTNTKPDKTSALTAGRVYSLNAQWDGAKLAFKTIKESHVFAINSNRPIAICEQLNNKIIIVDSLSSKIEWEWDPAKSSLPSEHIKCFRNLDEVKPIYKKKYIMVTASAGGGVAIIRIADKKVMFYALPGANTHSAEILPDGNLVVACSTGDKPTSNSILVYKVDTLNSPGTYNSIYGVYSAHNVVWDHKNQKLMATAHDKLNYYKYNFISSNPKLELTDVLNIPGTGAHDLFPVYGENALWLTNSSGIYKYDIKTQRSTETSFSMPNIKSVSSGPPGFGIILIKPTTSYWSDKILNSNQKTVFYGLNYKMYKARWFIDNPFSYGEDSEFIQP